MWVPGPAPDVRKQKTAHVTRSGPSRYKERSSEPSWGGLCQVGEQGQHREGLENVGEEGRVSRCQDVGPGPGKEPGLTVDEGQWGLLETGWRPGAHPPPAVRAGLRGAPWQQGRGGDPQPRCWAAPVRGGAGPELYHRRQEGATALASGVTMRSWTSWVSELPGQLSCQVGGEVWASVGPESHGTG